MKDVEACVKMTGGSFKEAPLKLQLSESVLFPVWLPESLCVSLSALLDSTFALIWTSAAQASA